MKSVNDRFSSAFREIPSLMQDGQVPSEFNGYISSLGAAIRLCGLPAAIAMYSRADRSAEEKRKLIAIIERILESDYETGKIELLKKVSTLSTPDQLWLLQEQIETICIALKLALRTFPQRKSTEA